MGIDNPFTPAFGGMPHVFFGRSKELGFAQKAMDNGNSPHKVFFITGNRGSGKTTLLERMSRMAAERKWTTVDVHSTHAVQSIVEALAGGTQRISTKEARPTALGVSVGGASVSTTTSYSEASLASLLVDTCGKPFSGRGVFITIDEIQKVPESDAEAISAAVQLALRKGLPVILALAGLPRSKEQVASYPGCTFMQRAYDMQIGCLEVDETLDALRTAFAGIPELEVPDGVLWRLGLFSQGYPYLMQLAGYYLVERMDAFFLDTSLQVSPDDVDAIEPVALESYRANVLEPVLSVLPPSLESYLRSMCEAQDEHGRVRSGDVARLLSRQPQQVSSYRQRLIDKRLIEPDGQGYARFLLPHIPEYYSDWREQTPKDPSQQWNRQI